MALTRTEREPGERLQARWRRLLAASGEMIVRAPSSPTIVAPQAEVRGGTQVELREVFVRADLEERRMLDLVCAAMVERITDDHARRVVPELVLFGPETLRSQMTPNRHGLSISDVRVCAAGANLHTVSVVLLRVPRWPRVRQIVVSIQALGESLDYERDQEGSDAVADTLLGRLGVLAATRGVAVSVAGSVAYASEPAESHHVLAPAAAVPERLAMFEIRDGRLVSVAQDGRATTWREGDYVLIRIGPARTRPRQGRSIQELRREAAVVEVEPGAEPSPDEESYSSRTARARQSANAEEIVRSALSDASEASRAAFAAALIQPGGDGPLIEGIANRISSPRHYWLVESVVASVKDDDRRPADVRSAATKAGMRLAARLQDILGQRSSGQSDVFIPVVTPVVLEVSDALVPIVDSSQDGGLFLYELVPVMRDRIQQSTGVRVPGVRARGNPGLPLGGYEIQLDEVRALSGNMDPDGDYDLRIPASAATVREADATDVHPLTGEHGLWILDSRVGDPSGDVQSVTSSQYLVHRIELVLRARLSCFLGPQEVAAMVDTWRGADEMDLVNDVLPDLDSRLRLTWLLQALVEDGLPVVDAQAILETVRDHGGMGAPMPVLRRAVRARLRSQLPRPWSPEAIVPVPGEQLEALLHISEARELHEARHAFDRWLRQTQAERGPAISLVTPSQEARELVAALSRPVCRLISAFTADELGMA